MNRHIFSAILASAHCFWAIVSVTYSQASMLTYEFHGTVSSGSVLETGSGLVDLSGSTFTVTGNTIDDVDLYASGAVGDAVGQFAATSTYDFGDLGSFTTDVGADYYYQHSFAHGFDFISGSGLVDLPVGTGFLGSVTPYFPGDPDFGVATGSRATGISFLGSPPRLFSNSSGDTMTLYFSSLTYMNINEPDGTIPEPSTYITLTGLILCFGLAGWWRKRRQAA